MAFVNENFLKLRAGYLFPEIGRRVKEYVVANPSAPVIRMGIGDVTEPLPPAVVEAMHKAVEEMARHETFRGYGPSEGYDFLRNAIVENEFVPRKANIAADEVFVSDGSKCDCANILDILGHGNAIAVTDPVYPVYVDTNVMAGNTGEADSSGEYRGLSYLRCTAETGFAPQIPTTKFDIVYLCSPNNPTGSVLDRSALTKWVAYAKANDAIILFDAAYEAYITDPAIPHSIFEIDGARECAIEFRSFSKTAGFTGVRAAFTVVPKSLKAQMKSGEVVEVYKLWTRRQNTKFNGISYIVQRAAESIYSPEGKQQTRALIDGYLANAKLIREGLNKLGMKTFGGVHAPYVWVVTPRGAKSWEYFDALLTKANVVCTPGSGFGQSGEGYVRLSAFNSRANVEEALSRISRL